MNKLKKSKKTKAPANSTLLSHASISCSIAFVIAVFARSMTGFMSQRLAILSFIVGFYGLAQVYRASHQLLY